MHNEKDEVKHLENAKQIEQHPKTCEGRKEAVIIRKTQKLETHILTKTYENECTAKRGVFNLESTQFS